MKLLPKSNYEKAVQHLKTLSINHLFARSVVENRVNGEIWVNDIENPDTFYIKHPYGMSLLFGNSGNEAFNNGLVDYILNRSNTRNGIEWLQAFPESWDKKLSALIGNNLAISEEDFDLEHTDLVIRQTRVNFIFNATKYAACGLKPLPENYQLVRTDTAIFESLEGTVIPSHFWNNAEDFCTHGIGFSLLHHGKAVSTAFSSFIHDRELELGIETLKAYQGRGLAKYACAALIEHCLTNRYAPIWACRLTNTGSYTLAQQLGFEPTKQIPYYRLSYSGLPDLSKVDTNHIPAEA